MILRISFENCAKIKQSAKTFKFGYIWAQDEDRSRPSNVKELVKNVTDRYRGYAEMEEEKERFAP